MQLRVLGPLELVDESGATIPFRGAQFRRALSTLSVHSPGSTPVDVLKDVLWPQGAPSPNALQALMSKLRKAIAPIEIDASGSAYTLVLGKAEIDAHRFERLVTAGPRSRSGRPPRRRGSTIGACTGHVARSSVRRHRRSTHWSGPPDWRRRHE